MPSTIRADRLESPGGHFLLEDDEAYVIDLDAGAIARAREASVRRRAAYGWDAVGAQTKELYETVLDQSRAHPA
jgi:hypothetical protein